MLAYAFADVERGLLDFLAYVAILVVGFCLVTLIIWRAYPLSRLRHEFGMDNVLGATVAAVWGALLLIALLTVLRFYSVSELQASAAGQPQQRPAQVALQHQIQQSQVAPVLEVATAPLWQALAPWFPSPVSARV
jgi:hypothetical protein